MARHCTDLQGKGYAVKVMAMAKQRSGQQRICNAQKSTATAEWSADEPRTAKAELSSETIRVV